MTLVSLACIVYCLLPLGAAGITAFTKKAEGFLNGIGLGLSICRILLLGPIIDAVLIQKTALSFSYGFIDEFSIRLATEWNGHRVWFLLTLDFCLLLSQLMNTVFGQHKKLIEVLAFALQAVLTIYILSANFMITYVAQMVAAFLLFYIIRFSLPRRKADGEYISNRIAVIYSTLSILGIVWAIVEYSPAGGRGAAALVLGPSQSYGSAAIILWLISAIVAVPISPWSNWFNKALTYLPEGITVILIAFLSCVIMRNAEIYLVTYTNLSWSYKSIIYLFGLIGCVFSLIALFAMESKRAMLGCMPKFFLSLVLMSIGVAHRQGLEGIYLLCLFIPIFSGLMLYASALNLNTVYQRVFIGFFLIVLVGIPGTPVYQIFSLVGSRSLDMGVEYTLVFTLVWFFYFYSNVFICRRMFLDETLAEIGVNSVLTRAPVIVTSYAIFLLLFIGSIALMNWGLL